MEIYIKGKFEDGIGSAAYVVVGEDAEVVRGAMNFGTRDGQTFPCDQFNCEILAAICGLARCQKEELLNVYSNNRSVIKWLSKGDEPDGRTKLLDCYRRRALGKDVFVDYIPHFEKDPTGNKWNELCNRLATEALRK